MRNIYKHKTLARACDLSLLFFFSCAMPPCRVDFFVASHVTNHPTYLANGKKEGQESERERFCRRSLSATSEAAGFAFPAWFSLFLPFLPYFAHSTLIFILTQRNASTRNSCLTSQGKGKEFFFLFLFSFFVLMVCLMLLMI